MENIKKLYTPVEFRFGGLYESSLPYKLPIQLPKSDSTLKIPLNPQWPSILSIGPGLRNMGNTCFFNSVLQCLTYTPPLAGFFLHPKGHPNENCKKDRSLCWLCLLSSHFKQIFSISKPKTLSPIDILKCLKGVWKKFRFGSQEDSHEFLRIFLDNLQKAENYLINGVFAGKLLNQVQCLDCKAISDKSEAFMDLSLEVQKSDSVQKSLEIFFKKESLNGNNKYRCGKCKRLVNAWKGFQLEEGPMILTIHLKRFNNSLMKINKYVKFSDKLDMSPFMRDQKHLLIYELYAVVVHQGSQMWSGHYYSYVKNSNNLWYLMNDETVRLANVERVLNENAYLLFYVKKESSINGIIRKESNCEIHVGNGVGAIQTPNNSRKNSQSNGVSINDSSNHNNNNQLNGITQLQLKRGNSLPPVISNLEKNVISKIENEDYARHLEKLKEKEECRDYMNAIFKRSSSLKQEAVNGMINSKKNHENEKEIYKNGDGLVEKTGKIEKKHENKEEIKLEKEEIKLENIEKRQENGEKKLENSQKKDEKKVEKKEEKKVEKIKNKQDIMEEEPPLNSLVMERSTSKNSSQGIKHSKFQKLKRISELWGDLKIIKKRKVSEDAIKICISDENLSKVKSIDEIFNSQIQENDEEDENNFLLEGKKKILEKNPEYFTHKIQKKDAYDIEYDKGKMKKKKIKKESKRNDFQVALEYKNSRNRNGFQYNMYKKR